MGWKVWLLILAAIALVVSSVRLHYMPGHFGDHVTFEFSPPWSR
jgi:hypothetical protein